MADWSALPDLAVAAITDRLSSSADYIRFRSVCSSWRSAAPRRPHLPLLALDHPDDDTRVKTVFSFSTLSFPGPTLRSLPLPRSTLGSPCCGASNGWLALLDRTPGVSLFNPVTSARIRLPPFIPHFPGDLSRNYAKVSDDEYIFTNSFDGGTQLIGFVAVERLLACKVILSADPATTPDYVVLAIRGEWNYLEFCRPGDDTWTPIEHPSISGYNADAQFYRGRFYIAGGVHIYACSLGPSEAKAVEITGLDPPFHRNSSLPEIHENYLVEVGGDLLLVTLFYSSFCVRSYTAEVFKVDFNEAEQVKLLKLKSVGDYALFLGRNKSFSLPASKFPGLKGNRIYLAEYCQWEIDVRVIDLEKSSIRDCANEFLTMDLTVPGLYWSPCAWFRRSFLD